MHVEVSAVRLFTRGAVSISGLGVSLATKNDPPLKGIMGGVSLKVKALSLIANHSQ
jgi:hypothetical protein